MPEELIGEVIGFCDFQSLEALSQVNRKTRALAMPAIEKLSLAYLNGLPLGAFISPYEAWAARGHLTARAQSLIISRLGNYLSTICGIEEAQAGILEILKAVTHGPTSRIRSAGENIRRLERLLNDSNRPRVLIKMYRLMMHTLHHTSLPHRIDRISTPHVMTPRETLNAYMDKWHGKTLAQKIATVIAILTFCIGFCFGCAVFVMIFPPVTGLLLPVIIGAYLTYKLYIAPNRARRESFRLEEEALRPNALHDMIERLPEELRRPALQFSDYDQID